MISFKIPPSAELKRFLEHVDNLQASSNGRSLYNIGAGFIDRRVKKRGLAKLIKARLDAG